MYFKSAPDEKNPLGGLLKQEGGMLYRYRPETDAWEEAENAGTEERLTEDEAGFFRFELQAAEMLTRHYVADYLEGRNYIHVKEDEAYIRQLYLEGETPEDAAIFSGYSCG